MSSSPCGLSPSLRICAACACPGASPISLCPSSASCASEASADTGGEEPAQLDASEAALRQRAAPGDSSAQLLPTNLRRTLADHFRRPRLSIRPSPSHVGSDASFGTAHRHRDLSQTSEVHGSLGIRAEPAPPISEGAIILNAIAAKLKRRSKDDSHGRDPVNLA
jgi:hypothetical protein